MEGKQFNVPPPPSTLRSERDTELAAGQLSESQLGMKSRKLAGDGERNEELCRSCRLLTRRKTESNENSRSVSVIIHVGGGVASEEHASLLFRSFSHQQLT